jgi:hypothetical protein
MEKLKNKIINFIIWFSVFIFFLFMTLILPILLLEFILFPDVHGIQNFLELIGFLK